MDITPAARSQIYDKTEERRLELGLTWREVAAAAGISYEAVRALRTGPGGIRPLTKRKLDKALAWPPGQVDRIITLANADWATMPPVVQENWHNEHVRNIWHTPDLPLAAKEEMISDIAAHAEDGSPGAANAG